MLHLKGKMAAPVLKRLLRAMHVHHSALIKQTPLLSIAGNHASIAHNSTKTHVPNQRRTRAQVAKMLRPKQNFLHFDLVDKHRKSALQSKPQPVDDETETQAPRDYRFVMPEFMPRPEWQFRDRLREKLERQDMLRRRAIIDIPEFYVGSIMAVSVSDPHSPGKQNRFVGICIDRGGHGLWAYFLLRNVVEGLGVEVMYQMYNPVVQSIQVLKLEKRLDDQLYYLRNCPPEYSTFSFDMDPVPIPKGVDVPINPLKVPLNPKPWEWRWERGDFKGLILPELTEKQASGIKKSATPWKKHDLMLDYRSKVNEDEEATIMAEVYKEKQAIDGMRRSRKVSLKKRS